ncbi:MAG: hypothetical protein FJ010_13895 [Chloroflexi bacterium]|nr:hypothetical protein [Chloroflexota bacterium]
MSYLVVLVLDDPDHCSDVLHAWEEAGCSGITILESTGIGRIRRGGMRDDTPLMPSLSDIFRSSEIHHRTLFSVVETEDQCERLAAATQAIIGGLDQPDTGLMFVLQLHKAYGVVKAN